MNVSLDEDDLRHLLGSKTRIIAYPTLARYRRIEDALDANGRVMILFLTTSKTDGHWICIHVSPVQPHTLEFFDSYGLKPDGPRKWLSADELFQLKETRPLLTNLLKDAQERGWNLEYNDHKLQGAGHNVDTCGRHCAVRLKYAHLPIDSYVALIKNSGL